MFYTRTPYENFADIEKYFDNKKNLLYMPISRLVYSHTLLTAEYAYHICDSLEYSFYLLYTDKIKNKKKAESIISEVLKYQCCDATSHCFGYWNLFAEEDVSELNELDYGYCARIATILLQIYEKYIDILNAQLLISIKKAFTNTMLVLLSNYTSQNLVSTFELLYISIIGGEIFNNYEYIKYGEQRLQLLYNSMQYNNYFVTHNDMIYSLSCLKLLEMITNKMNINKYKEMCLCIKDMLWNTLATHYHAATMQIAGPTNLTNEDFTSIYIYNFLYSATGRTLPFPHSNNMPNEMVYCPEKYLPYFTGEKKVEYSSELISYGMTFPYFLFSMVATTYMRPDYTFGTYNRELFWAQRRPFIGYFKGENKPYCFKLEVLHDFYPYTSAALHCLQHYGHSIGHITFLTNKGDKGFTDGIHPHINAKDLRIRFSVLGDTDNLEITHSKNNIKIRHNNVTIFFSIPYIEIDGYSVKIHLSVDDNAVYFDAIIYSGEETTIDFTKMEKAICEFNFLITATNKKPFKAIRKMSDGNLISSFSSSNVALKLVTPVKPGMESVCLGYDKQYINNMQLEDYVIQANEKAKNYTYIEQINQYHPIPLPVSDIAGTSPNLSNKIDGILDISFENITEYISSVLKAISSSGYTFNLQKRMTIQIVVNLFDLAKNSNHEFEKMISDKYTNIFKKIISAENLDTITKDILQICHKMKKDKNYMESKYVNKELINNIFHLVSDNLLNPELSLEFIAGRLGYSSSHISRVFVESTGMNYVSYVQKEKMNYAIKQLKSKNKSILEVSEEIGYSNANNFLRTFKKIFGMTVTQYLNSEP